MANLLKLLFVFLPVVGQGIIQIQQSLGVNHPTIVGTIAGWLIALTISGRAVVSQQAKNVAAGTDTAGGGA